MITSSSQLMFLAADFVLMKFSFAGPFEEISHFPRDNLVFIFHNMLFTFKLTSYYVICGMLYIDDGS